MHYRLSSILLLTLGFGACSHSAKQPAAESSAPTVAEAPATATATVPTPPSEPSPPIKDIEVVYGLMTFVMDSPRGQQDQAEAAVKNSDLVRQLTGLVANVTFRFDKAAGDAVILKSASGVEIFRIPLIEVDGERMNDAASAKLKAAVSGN